MLALLTTPPVPRRISDEINWESENLPQFRRLHSNASASDRLESLNINSSLEVGGRIFLILERVASSIPLGIVKDSVHYSIMESSRADAASLQVSSFQSHFFLHVLRFYRLNSFMSLFSSKSNFLSNDVGCGSFLIGR